MSTEAEGEGPAGRARGRRFARLEAATPEWLSRHALGLGWAWGGLWCLMVAAEEVFDLAEGIFVLGIAVLVLPSLAATALCLWVTPRDHLQHRESVLGYFLVRFIAVVFAFVAWTVSIVIGASVSQTIQHLGDGDERLVLGLGIQIMIAVVPVVATLLWLGFITRCSLFLVRLRGWRARPRAPRLPDGFLATAPRLRALVLGLAHPGLLFATGVGGVIGLLLLALSGALLLVDA